jgi:HPt (histidine-containing phosphotransfer) domain-containing protein
LGGNRELFAALAATYVSEAASFMEQLPATAAADLPNLLHTFKSAAGIVGATELHNYAGELERSLRHGGAVIDTPAMLQRLHELVECSLTDLAQAVTTMA